MTDLHNPSRRALLLGLATSLTAAAACGGGSSPTSPSPSTGTWVANVPFSTTDLEVGTGNDVSTGSRVVADYIGYLYDTTATANANRGTAFDGSCQAVCSPLTFTVGAGTLIRGFEQGVIGMKAGGIRRVTIPPDLAYGAAGSAPRIPGNATLIFEIRVNASEGP